MFLGVMQVMCAFEVMLWLLGGDDVQMMLWGVMQMMCSLGVTLWLLGDVFFGGNAGHVLASGQALMGFWVKASDFTLSFIL